MWYMQCGTRHYPADQRRSTAESRPRQRPGQQVMACVQDHTPLQANIALPWCLATWAGSGLWSPGSKRLRIGTGQPAKAATATKPTRTEACMQASGSHASCQCSCAVYTARAHVQGPCLRAPLHINHTNKYRKHSDINHFYAGH